MVVGDERRRPMWGEAWWHKSGPGKMKPWAIIVDETVIDYNQAYVAKWRRVYADLGLEHLSDDEFVRVAASPTLIKKREDELEERRLARIAEIERARVEKERADLEVQEREREATRAAAELAAKPNAEFKYVDGKLTCVSYNQPFITDLRVKLGSLVDENTPDDAIIKKYIEREELEHEEPRLDVLHTGINDDGSLKIKLDWNRAFINLLKAHGITAETEEDAIKEYLSRMTSKVDDEISEEFGDFVTREELQDRIEKSAREAYAAQDEILALEYREAEEQARKPKRRRKVNRLGS